jgi:hypothetical protein
VLFHDILTASQDYGDKLLFVIDILDSGAVPDTSTMIDICMLSSIMGVTKLRQMLKEMVFAQYYSAVKG